MSDTLAHLTSLRARWKPELARTLVSMLFFTVVGYIMCTIQLLGDARMIDRGLTAMSPLPDLGLEYTPHPPWLPRWFCELTAGSFMAISLVGCIISAKKHQGGFVFFLIYMRRFFWLAGLCYLLRLLALGGTTLPSSDPRCVFQRKISGWEWVTIGPLLFFGVKDTCTDKLFSGHTSVSVILLWFWVSTFWRKSSRVTQYLARIFALFMAISAMTTLIIAKIHYTVDIVVACFISTLIFHVYHLIIWIKEGYDRGLSYFDVTYGGGPHQVIRMHHLEEYGATQEESEFSASGSPDRLASPVGSRKRGKSAPAAAQVAFGIVAWMEGLDIRTQSR